MRYVVRQIADALGKVVPIGLMVLAGALVLVVTLAATAEKICWVGSTDLEIIFLVEDADNSKPVDGATIYIFTEEYDDNQPVDTFMMTVNGRKKKRIKLTTDAGGLVKHLCKDCRCSGTVSRNEDTFMLWLPDWDFVASAPGYRRSEIMQFEPINPAKWSERLDRNRQERLSKMTVPMKLSKRG